MWPIHASRLQPWIYTLVVYFGFGYCSKIIPMDIQYVWYKCHCCNLHVQATVLAWLQPYFLSAYAQCWCCRWHRYLQNAKSQTLGEYSDNFRVFSKEYWWWIFYGNRSKFEILFWCVHVCEENISWRMPSIPILICFPVMYYLSISPVPVNAMS